MTFLLKVLVLILGLVSVQGINIMDRCSHGSSYYCRNFNTAKHCGKINYCKTVFWSQTVQVSETCTLCKDAVKGVDYYLEKNATKQTIESSLMRVCKDVPLSSLSTECQQTVSEDFDMLYDEIVVIAGNGDLICGALGLCSSSVETNAVDHFVDNLPSIVKNAMENNMLPVAAPVLIQERDDCSDCQSFLKDLQSAIKNKKQMMNDWKELVKSECDALGPGMDKICYDNIEEAIATVANGAMSRDNTMSLCKSMNLCNLRKSKVDDSCTDCKNFFSDFEKKIAQNSSYIDEVVKNIAQVYCLQKPQFLQKQCTTYVAMVIRTAINRIISEPPARICRALEFCDASNTIKFQSLQVAGIKVPRSGDYCKDCTTFMTDLQGVAKNNQSIIDDLTDLIKEQCDQLGPELSQLCKLQVTTAAPQLIAQFEALDVGTICTTILMCSSPPTEPPKGGDLCNDCIAFTQDWQAIIQNNKSIINNHLRFLIDGYCNQMPIFLKDKCKSDGESILVKLIDVLTKNDAETICSTVYMCDAMQSKKSLVVNSKETSAQVKNSVSCELCETVAEALDDLLEKNSTEAEIIAAVDKVCTILPTKYRDECNDLVKEYGDTIIQLLVNAVSPQKLCSTLGLCSLPPMKSLQKSTDGCELCHLVVTELDRIIAQNSSQAAVIEALENVCNIYSSDIREECKMFIEEHGKEVVDLLINELNPEQVCSKLTLCTSKLALKVPRSGDYCKDCTTFMTDLQGVAKNNQSIINDLTDLVKQQCEQLGPGLSELCEKSADMIVGDIVNAISSNDVGTICTTILMCSSPPTEPPKGGDLCKDCVAFTQDWQAIIQNNKTLIDQINSMIAQECSMLGPDFEKLCATFVKDFLPYLWNLISYNDAQSICTTLYMCGASQQKTAELAPLRQVAVEEKSVAKKGKVSDPVSCALCRIVVHELDKMIRGNRTEAAITHALEEVCHVVPGSYRKDCMRFIEKYGKDVVDMLINEVESGVICTNLFLCSPPPPRVVTSKKASTACDLCVIIANELDNLIEENSTETEIIDAIDKVCSLLPSQYGEECKALIDEYGPKLIQALINKVPAEKLCSTIGLCSSKLRARETASTACDLCVIIANELDNLIEENSTETEIIDAIDKVCSLLPSQYGEECKALINEYGSKLIQALINKVPAEKLCSTIGLCSSKLRARVTTSVSCFVCQVVVVEIDRLVLRNKTEMEIIGEAKKLCGILPDQYRQECDYFVDKYTTTVIKLLMEFAQPGFVCAELGLCTSKKVTQPKVKLDVCSICKLVASKLEQLITTNSTQAEIEAALDKVCSLLPGDLSSQCDDFIKTNAPAILKLLAQEIAPAHLCPALGLCKQLRGSDLCSICKDVIIFLDSILGTNATKEDIEKALDSLCDQMPSAFKSECDDFVAAYTPEIIALAEHIFDPDYVCVHLRLCGSSPKNRLVGTNPCTYGPSYWCKDKQTAARCNEMEHCRLHVWN